MSSFAPAAAYYDLLYAHIRDYAADTRALLALFADVTPSVQRVLDVACGRGERDGVYVGRKRAVAS